MVTPDFVSNTNCCGHIQPPNLLGDAANIPCDYVWNSTRPIALHPVHTQLIPKEIPVLLKNRPTCIWQSETYANTTTHHLLTTRSPDSPLAVTSLCSRAYSAREQAIPRLTPFTHTTTLQSRHPEDPSPNPNIPINSKPRSLTTPFTDEKDSSRTVTETHLQWRLARTSALDEVARERSEQR